MKIEPRADLMKASGQVGLNKPFRAPIYRSYYECISGLYKQGILGFYKGNGLRVLHAYLFLSYQTYINNQYIEGDDVFNQKPNYFKTLFSALSCSAILHVIHLGEARFVL